MVQTALAETGSVLVQSLSVLNYADSSGAGAGNIAATRIYFDIANYNSLQSFHITATAETPTFALDSETTSFTCTGGASCTGTAWYVKEYKTIYYVFDGNPTVTSSPITLSYAKNIFANITGWTKIVNSVCIVSITQPLYLYKEENVGNRCLGGNYGSVTIASQTTDTYNATYPFSGGFTLSVIKGKSINDAWKVMDANGVPYVTGSMNKLDFSFTNSSYNGIVANISTGTGASTILAINLTGSTGTVYVPPTPPIIVNPITGVGIQFDHASYSMGEIANISWIRTIETPLLCTDYIRLQTPSSKYDLVVSPSDSGYTKELLSELGTHTVSFERGCLFGGTEILDSDTAFVGSSEQTSYIYAPAQVGVGQLFNVTYLIGWTKTAGSTVWLRDYTWDDATNAYGDTYQPWALSGSIGVETNQSILVTKTGKHLLKVCDVLFGCKASTTLTAYFNGSEVTTNISVSNITIDKTSYSYGETILVKTAVDNFNWTNKQIVVEYEDYDEGIIQNQKYIQVQIESFPLYISDLTFSGSGASRLRLTGKNSTGDYILAYVNFTLSNVDSEGYGLSVIGDTNCIKDTVQINVIVPVGEVGNLTISADDAKYNKAYTVNGTKTISYKYQIDGTYYFTLSVDGEAKRVIIKEISSGGSCAIPVPTITYVGINGTWTPTNENIKETCSYWDTWIRAIFGVQGVNDVTRILFALGAIVAMMFIGLIASKGNFGVAIILGFFPYAFFTYLSLSTPCGQYMPLWINIFIALIIGIKMKWFS